MIVKRTFTGSSRPARRGLTLVEISITMSILVGVLLGFCEALLGSMSASRSHRETALATDAARQIMETLQATDLSTVFAINNGVVADDPAGAVVRLGAFAVPGLTPAPGDADGLCGEILFPEIIGAGASQLREDVEDRLLNMPRDLNGDGVVDALDHSGDYMILPVIVRVTWRGGKAQFKTILSNF